MSQKIEVVDFPHALYYRGRAFSCPEVFFANEVALSTAPRKNHFLGSWESIEEVARDVNEGYTRHPYLPPTSAWLLCNTPRTTLPVRQESFCLYYVVAFEQGDPYVVSEYRAQRKSFVEEHVLWSVDLRVVPVTKIAALFHNHPEIFSSIRTRFQTLYGTLSP